MVKKTVKTPYNRVWYKWNLLYFEKEATFDFQTYSRELGTHKRSTRGHQMIRDPYAPSIDPCTVIGDPYTHPSETHALTSEIQALPSETHAHPSKTRALLEKTHGNELSPGWGTKGTLALRLMRKMERA